MEILLVQDVESLGQRGDLVNVAKGYYRNFLGPKGMATIASEGNKRILEEQERVLARRDVKTIAVSEELAARIEGLSFKVAMQANEEGHLYGSVTEQTIVKLLEGKKVEIEPRHVKLEDHIKELGDYEIEIGLHGTIRAGIKLKVVQE